MLCAGGVPDDSSKHFDWNLMKSVSVIAWLSSAEAFATIKKRRGPSAKDPTSIVQTEGGILSWEQSLVEVHWGIRKTHSV